MSGESEVFPRNKIQVYHCPIIRDEPILGELQMQKTVHIRLDRATDLSLTEVLEKIQELQKENPDLDVFFDGDEYAICSRPRQGKE